MLYILLVQNYSILLWVKYLNYINYIVKMLILNYL
nr:MAG TPA: hypothetical protein [Caudoviricetes sp.]